MTQVISGRFSAEGRLTHTETLTPLAFQTGEQVKIPCVCETGFHSFTANEMVQIIAAFQRGELARVTNDRGNRVGILPVCLANADFDAGVSNRYSGPCDVLMADGTMCKLPRGHREGRHGVRPQKGSKRVSSTDLKSA